MTSYTKLTKEHLLNQTKPDPWTDLANAVVAQAADDYRRLCNKLVKFGETMSEFEMNVINGKIGEIKWFFESEYGDLLAHGMAMAIWERLQDDFRSDLDAMWIKREARFADEERKGVRNEQEEN